MGNLSLVEMPHGLPGYELFDDPIPNNKTLTFSQRTHRYGQLWPPQP
jgi:hypothetical protein